MIALSLPASPPRCPTIAANVVTLARRELRDALRSRWFLLYTLAFAALGLGVSFVSAASAGGGMAGFGRTSAGLVNLVLLVIPLMALTAGAGTIASDRERGMLPYLLAQPITRAELLLGKFVGLGLTLVASICLGFGVVAATLGWSGSATHAASLLGLVALSIGLSLAMLSVGLLISTIARQTGVATGTAIFLWLALVLVSDLGLMAGALTFKLSIEQLFALAVANPLQVFKMWSLQSFDASLDVLGPAGLYAQQSFGHWLAVIFATVLLAWITMPLAIAALLFSRRSSP